MSGTCLPIHKSVSLIEFCNKKVWKVKTADVPTGVFHIRYVKDMFVALEGNGTSSDYTGGR